MEKETLEIVSLNVSSLIICEECQDVPSNCSKDANSLKPVSYIEGESDNLRIADFSYNNISSINAGDIVAIKLIYLNLSRNQIKTIHTEAFLEITLLISLDLSHNKIVQIFHGTFSALENLEELYLQGNPFQVAVDMFKGLYSLKMMEVSFYTVCCARPNSIYNVKCVAPVNEISSCEQLIAVPPLNVAIWYIALIASFGNMTVFLYNASNFNSKKAGAYHILTLNLSCADFLMGVYLYTIAIINLHYTGQYGLNDYVWRHSTICTLSGIIATLSSEVSAFIVLLITMDRFIAVKYPFSDFKLTRKKGSVLLFIALTLSLFLALIPLIPDPNLENFYAQSGICVSLPLSITRKSGWQYSMIVYVGINFLLFLGILVGQISIFVEVVSVGRNVRSTKTKQRESSLAMTLFAVVVTDVFCWLPIGTIGMLTFFGIEVQPDVYAWMIVVVLPINSAINPILYTLTAFIRNKVMSHNLFGFRDQKKSSQRAISSMSGTPSRNRDIKH
ncbi:G-protein coupled receptor GRL101-like [Saccostrea echinata]|uniref:G-protein coupled receptor GRL101-like n=1 Tax=Saccostrea echinata TaxID=191078 RepID=UPI002A8196D0|nr:G-protein coupled receptor GRL101-like [Saccostrea echinata]